MAGLDPAIQTRHRAVVARIGWMAASRAAMTSGGCTRAFTVRVLDKLKLIML
jgi:hypothetical protein